MKRQSIKHIKKALKTVIFYCSEISFRAKVFKSNFNQINRF